MKRLTTWLVAAALFVGLSSSAWAETRYVLVTLLHTNDMHGVISPADGPGGLARIATLVRGIRAEMPNVVLLDAGDIIHGTPEDYYSGGLASISAMNATGYQLATPGNHEFDFGLDTLRGVASTAVFPFISANIKSAAGGQWDKIGACAVVVVDGLRIGVFGLATPETVTYHWPGSIKDIKVEDPYAAAAAMVPELRKQADVIVALSHLGEAGDVRLAQSVPGIDFIVGGHSHTVISERKKVGSTVIAQAGTKSEWLGRIDFIARVEDTGTSIMSVNGVTTYWADLPTPPLGRTYPKSALISVGRSIPEDSEVLKAYLPYRESTTRLLARVVGQAAGPIPGGGVDSPAANLVADAVRSFAGSDIALIDSKSVSVKGLAGGAVSVGQLHDLIGGYTRQQIVVGRMTGGDLVKALTAHIAKAKPATLAVSGASYTYNAPASVKLSVETSVVYTVAAQAYVMMDIMKAVPNVEIVSEPRETTREALVKYFERQGVVAVPGVGRVKAVTRV